MQSIEKPFIVPFFIPHAGCPHQCAFCNQRTISGRSLRSGMEYVQDIENAVNLYSGYSKKKHEHVQVAFFGGNFLGMGEKTVLGFLDAASRLHSKGLIDSIRFSTRPDTINRATIDILKDYPVSTIEIGTQSMDQRVLDLSARGHSPEHTAEAAWLCRTSGFETGIQMMTGLPGEDRESCINTGRLIAALDPDFVRIYPTVVVGGSPLADSYDKGEYLPLELDEAVARAKQLYLLFRSNNIRVIRMGLQATDDLLPGSTVLAGPYHPAFGHLVLSSIFLDRIRERFAIQFEGQSPENRNLQIKCSCRSVSRVRGDKNRNIIIMKAEYRLSGISVIPDKALDDEDFGLSLM